MSGHNTRQAGRPADVTRTELEAAVERYERGATAVEAAAVAGVSASAVKRYGVRMRSILAFCAQNNENHSFKLDRTFNRWAPS